MSISFHEMSLSKPMLEALKASGFEHPTPVQEKTIPLLLAQRNVVGQAQTGSGKTLAFAIPILERINHFTKVPQALVIVPTRELALQVQHVFSTMSPRSKNIKSITVYGGASRENQHKLLRSGAHIIVATPGRLIDFMRQGQIRLNQVRTVILDEADRMFDMGFINDVKWILGRLEPKSQISLFSATMPLAIRQIIETYVHDPAYVRLGNLAQDKPKISAQFYRVQTHEKLGFLLNILKGRDSSTLIFCRTRGGADRLAKNLHRSGHSVGAIHGGKNQNQRDRVMKSFRGGHLGVLVATDVASRGLDIDNIACVVNYDVPREPEDYIHRVGRTARAGKQGSAITLVTPMEREHVQKIEKLMGERMNFVHGFSNGHNIPSRAAG